MSKIDEAIAFAAWAHADQTRKYTGEPYVMHPLEVMMLVRTHAHHYTETMLIAALLHDVVEDTAVSLETIERRFGEVVRRLVDDLTDQFTSEAYPDMNRAARKNAEALRMTGVLPAAQTIKLADLISNTASITEHDPGFAKVYLVEKAKMLTYLSEGDKALFLLAQQSLEKNT